MQDNTEVKFGSFQIKTIIEDHHQFDLTILALPIIRQNQIVSQKSNWSMVKKNFSFRKSMRNFLF